MPPFQIKFISPDLSQFGQEKPFEVLVTQTDQSSSSSQGTFHSAEEKFECSEAGLGKLRCRAN